MRRPQQEIAELDDEALLRLVVIRRADAFDELYRRHAFAVAAVAARASRNRSDADEATQSAFLALWRRAPSVVVRGASLRAWLVTVGRNAAIDRARGARPVHALDASHETIPASEPGPEDSAMQRDTSRSVRAALEALDPDQRSVVELAYFGGLSQTEIAVTTGVPLGTVKGRIRLAMRHLRRALSPAEELA